MDGAFEAKQLTAAEFAALKDSTLLGVGTATPEASGLGGASSGLTETSASVGASTFKRRLVPRHRQAIAEFFKANGQASSSTPQNASGSHPGDGDKKR